MQSQPRPDHSRSKEGPSSATPRKRFHIQKLEERIAPKKGGKGTNNCSGGDSSNQAESGGSVSAY